MLLTVAFQMVARWMRKQQWARQIMAALNWRQESSAHASSSSSGGGGSVATSSYDGGIGTDAATQTRSPSPAPMGRAGKAGSRQGHSMACP